MERVISSKTIFSCPVFSVTENVVETADGIQAKHYYIERPGGVVILALDRQQRLLLTREWRSAAGRVLWYLPMGQIDAGESPEDAAQRELQEETGFRAGELTLISKEFSTSGYIKQSFELFLAKGLAPARLDGDETENVEVVPTKLPRVWEMVENLEIETPVVLLALLRLKNFLRQKDIATA